MNRIKFANVLLECNPRSVSYPALYCRSNKPFVFNEENSEWVLYGEGAYDFTTYFNALSINKLRRYTNATKAYLHLELKGAACCVAQTVATALDHESNILQATKRELPESSEYQAADFELTTFEDTILAGFVIQTTGNVAIANSYYTLECEEPLHEVELALATTTFKKEQYIEANIQQVKEKILGSSEDIASHFTMHVVDNGSTLNVDDLQAERVYVHPNSNVGGAGGFAYGMILAMEQQPRATHVLLMDDDVAVSPESLKRTYNLLRIVNSEYKEAFISGAMLNYDAGDEQWEDMGYITNGGFCRAIKPPFRLSHFDEIILNETHWVPKDIANPAQRYAAWWYCCIPITQIEKNGLPLPYFVRFDDAEYGARCKPHFITMNSLCIWHEAFHNRYNAAVERYQTTRNAFIAQNTTGFAPMANFEAELKHNVHLELKKFAYDNAELCLDAFEDFLGGPSRYSHKGFAEKTFMAANKNKEKLIPFNELEKQAHKLGLADFNISTLNRQLIDTDQWRHINERAVDLLTDNYQKVHKKTGKGYVVIPAAGWVYPAGVIRGKRYIIAVDWFNKVGVIRQRDTKRYAEILQRYKDDMKQYKKVKSELRKEYAESRDYITSTAFWKQYLGIQ